MEKTAIYGRTATKQKALYGRTSTGKQDTGLEAQMLALNSWCDAHGIVDRIEFLERGVSGTKDSRPQLNKMMAMARSGEIDTIIIYSFSRLSRSLRHMIQLADELLQLKVNLISVKDAVDTTTAMGRAMFSIIGVFSQLERDLTAERVKTGLKAAVERGERLGRPAKARAKSDEVMVLHSQGVRPDHIALQLDIGIASVYRALASRQKVT